MTDFVLGLLQFPISSEVQERALLAAASRTGTADLFDEMQQLVPFPLRSLLVPASTLAPREDYYRMCLLFMAKGACRRIMAPYKNRDSTELVAALKKNKGFQTLEFKLERESAEGSGLWFLEPPDISPVLGEVIAFSNISVLTMNSGMIPLSKARKSVIESKSE